MEQFYNLLIPKDRNLDRIAADAVKNPEIISYLLEGVKNKNVRIRYGCFNTLVLISEKHPEILYARFEFIKDFLDSENKIIRLGGIKIIANLTCVDKNKSFDKIFEKFYAFIKDPEMTTAANVTKGSPSISKAKPYLSEKIVIHLLTVMETEYKTEECKNILIGHVINSFDKMFNQIENKKGILKFVEMNTNNSWKGTKNKAEKFLKKYNML